MDDLTILDVEHFPVSWQGYVGRPRGRRLSIAIRTFIDFMYREGPRQLPGNINYNQENEQRHFLSQQLMSI